MNISEYMLYCLAVVMMIAMPGPVMLLVASAGLKGGYRHALQTIFGTNLASLVLIVLSVLSLKGLLLINEQWWNAIKLLGCIYIGYLGLQIFREFWQGQVARGHQSLPAVFVAVFWSEFPILKIFFSSLPFFRNLSGLRQILI